MLTRVAMSRNPSQEGSSGDCAVQACKYLVVHGSLHLAMWTFRKSILLFSNYVIAW